MSPCLCGHLHLSAVTCWCGCPQYIPDDGGDGDTRNPGPDSKADPYDGIYGTGRKFTL